MTNMDLDGSALDGLVQRFVDHELSAEERVRLLVRLGRDSALRERVVELEQLLLDVGRLPRPEVPARFVARVLERLGPPAPPLWQRLADALWTPRTLRWNLATAGVLLVTASLVVARLPWRWAPGDATRASVDATRASVDATPAAPVLVRLVVVRPGARTVEAAGDFNGWNPASTPLSPATNGAWTATIPLQPGRYEYMFVVDGRQWIVDPFATERAEDGFGAQNAVLEVRAPRERPL